MNQVGPVRPAVQFSRYVAMRPQQNPFVSSITQPDAVKFGNDNKTPDGPPKPPQDLEKRRKSLIRLTLMAGAAALGLNFLMASQQAAQMQAQNPVMVPAEFSTTNPNAPQQIPYTQNAVLSGPNEALALIRGGHVKTAKLVENQTMGIRPFYEFQLSNGVTVALMDNLNQQQQEELTKALRERNVQPQRVGYESSFFGSLIGMLLPVIVMVLLWRFMMGGGMGGGAGLLGGLTKAPTRDNAEPVRFSDIRGYPEVVKELKKITNRFVYGNLGRGNNPIKTKPIKGFLLEGPPGTGKTMMAKAIATEAGVPFHYMSASDFVQMFVGLGAARVKDLFAQAKKSADEKGGAIIFIDEIDSIGQKRGNIPGISGGNDEREQTLNALLQELSGFASDNRIMVMAATNRAELLDDALMRSGRFDKKIKVDLPYTKEQRADILDVYLAKQPTAKNLDKDAMAELTMGMSGADLANLVNQMAEVAAERINTALETEDGKKLVASDPEFSKLQTRDFNDTIRNMHMGLKSGQLGSPEERKVVAVHEVVGHGFVAKAAKLAVYLISMEPRGQALGHVMLDPRNASKLLPRFQDWMKDLVVTMGGRASEVEMLGNDNITPGAASDIQQARAVIRKMMATGMLPGTGAGDYLNPNFPMKDEDQKLMQELLDGAEEAARKVIKQVDPNLLWSLVNKATDLKEEIQGADANKFYEDAINQVGADKLYKPIQEYIEKFAKLNLPAKAADTPPAAPPTAA